MQATKSVGFSGTQDGMTPEQKDQLDKLLGILKHGGFRRFRYGVCIGSDDEAAKLATKHGYYLEGFPGDNPDKRGIWLPDRMFPPEKNLDRNWKLASSNCLLACPAQMREIRRSGTWSTVRRARDKLMTPYAIIFPDGTMFGTMTPVNN